jgi:hypothetical protein
MLLEGPAVISEHYQLRCWLGDSIMDQQIGEGATNITED